MPAAPKQAADELVKASEAEVFGGNRCVQLIARKRKKGPRRGTDAN